MGEMRNFEAEAAEAVRRAGRDIAHLFDHPDEAAQGADPYPQTPAQQPVNLAAAPAAAATTQEETMSLSTIAGDIKTAIGNADSWVKEVTEQHLPAILAQAAKYESSPVIQALESALLPPAVELQIAGLITELSKTYPAAPAADPAPTGQQPVQQDAPAQ